MPVWWGVKVRVNFISTLLSEIKQMEKFPVKIKHVKLIQKCFINLCAYKIEYFKNFNLSSD